MRLETVKRMRVHRVRSSCPWGNQVQSRTLVGGPRRALPYRGPNLLRIAVSIWHQADRGRKGRRAGGGTAGTGITKKSLQLAHLDYQQFRSVRGNVGENRIGEGHIKGGDLAATSGNLHDGKSRRQTLGEIETIAIGSQANLGRPSLVICLDPTIRGGESGARTRS